jgi:hypothetical protein
MIMRLYKWYEQQPKSLPIENLPSENDQRLGIEFIKPEPKKRGRKPKANG